jgi:hypothetical protein
VKIEDIRKNAGREEIDYQFLMSQLANYANPRDKISDWLRAGSLIRVKKGIYVFGKNSAISPYSLAVLANLIYGPSAISLRYALSYYGLIPERVTTVTSVTNKRNRDYSTPVGEFTYAYLHPQKYPIEIELKEINGQHVLIASPEKALCDHIHLQDRAINLVTLKDVEDYLLHDLRMNEQDLVRFRINRLTQLSKAYQDKRLLLLVQLISQWKSSHALSH